jgi:hypothetical protein
MNLQPQDHQLMILLQEFLKELLVHSPFVAVGAVDSASATSNVKHDAPSFKSEPYTCHKRVLAKKAAAASDCCFGS